MQQNADTDSRKLSDTGTGWGRHSAHIRLPKQEATDAGESVMDAAIKVSLCGVPHSSCANTGMRNRKLHCHRTCLLYQHNWRGHEAADLKWMSVT